MREVLWIVVVVSGGMALLGIYSFLEYSRGVTKSEIERATAVVNAVTQRGESPNLTYWINVLYLKLIEKFKIFILIVFAIFIISFVTLLFL